ncbi:hypothetical protein LCGC14_1977370, partial [marine sediment metagenome]
MQQHERTEAHAHAEPERSQNGATSAVAPYSGAARPCGPDGREMSQRQQGESWTPEQLAVQVWLATPQRGRRPRTQRGLAERLGISEFTVSHWKSLPGFGDAVLAMAREHIKSSDIGRILQSQIAKALRENDTPAARYVTEAVGGMAPTRGKGGTVAAQVIIINDGRPHNGAIDAIS